jgi:16S rRNA processing protein RimM
VKKTKRSQPVVAPTPTSVPATNFSLSAFSQQLWGSLNSTPLPELITVAKIGRPQGVKGEVIADLLTDFPERFDRLVATPLFITNPRRQSCQLTLTNYWFHKGRVVLKFAGIDDRNQAEVLRDCSVQVPFQDAVVLPQDTYYEFDLVDCQVYTVTGELIGKVASVWQTGAVPLLVVVSTSATDAVVATTLPTQEKPAKEYLIPLAEDICPEIDITEKKIIINPPIGLLNLP